MKSPVQILRSIPLLFLLPAVLFALAPTVGAKPDPSDVLIIYSSGNVPPDGKRDAVTTPTPSAENMKTVAQKLEKALKKRKLSVRLASVEENIPPEELLTAKVLVLGSPAYWSNLSWQMKKYVDETLTPMFSMPGKMKGLKTAAFSMANLEPNAMKTIDALFDVVTIFQGACGPYMFVLVRQTPEEKQQRIDQFADKIASFEKQ